MTAFASYGRVESIRVPTTSNGSGIPVAGRVGKRIADVVLSSIALAVIFPALLLVALLIRLDSSGPVLFTQVRVGENGRHFRILKLRTMHKDTDDALHTAYVEALINGEAQTHDGMYKLANDPRITRLGRWLRRLSVDELPQLVNVLRGDMSLVGPRPALPKEVRLYDDAARRRLAGKPGLTGLWQVSGRSTLSFHTMVELDLHYLTAWTPLLDLRILLRTPLAVITTRGAV